MSDLNKGGEAANMGMTKRGFDKRNLRSQVTGSKPTPRPLDKVSGVAQPRKGDASSQIDSSMVRTKKSVGI